MSLEQQPIPRTSGATGGRHRQMPVLAALLIGTVIALTGCATTGVAAPTVERLGTTQYAPTTTVDVLGAMPTRAFEQIARLQVSDPTGVATQSQLVAQLSEAAKSLGANALVVDPVSRSTGADVAFNPAGGQIQQSAGATGPISITAVALRYTP